ncbi:hypothetical protein GCM10018966_079600 [Streptomyces yanii]
MYSIANGFPSRYVAWACDDVGPDVGVGADDGEVEGTDVPAAFGPGTDTAPRAHWFCRV